MVYLHKILVAACVSLALALTFSCSLDDIVDDKSSSSLGRDSSSSLSSGGTGGVSSSSSSEVTVSSSSSSEGTSSSSSSSEESENESVNCLFRNYVVNQWFCLATSDEYKCVYEWAVAQAEAEYEGYDFDMDYVVVPSCDGYPTEYFQTMPLGSAGAGCLIKDYEDGDYFCKVVSTKDKCESSMDYTRYIYEPVDSCEGYSVDGWEPLHGCLILGTNGEEHTCVEVPNEAHCNKIFTNYGGSSSEFIDSCAGHGVG